MGTWKQQGLFPLWNHLLPQHLPVLLGTSDGTWPACCQLGAEGRGWGPEAALYSRGWGSRHITWLKTVLPFPFPLSWEHQVS